MELLHGEALQERAALALDVPVVRALGAALVRADDPTSGIWTTVAGPALNGAGGMHASALGAALECAAYLALVPHLGHDEHAVTHSITLSLLTAVPEGARVEARGEVDRRTRRLAFLTAVAHVGGEAVARAQLVKSIVPFG